jgi:8-oxo-dGTP pyrophosphatase MutT (NUDIX family)
LDLDVVVFIEVTHASANSHQLLCHLQRAGRGPANSQEDTHIWALPGGHAEPGESFEDAATREALEETGYHVVIEHLVGEYWRPQLANGRGDILRVFACRVSGGDASLHGWESLAVRWFPIDALPWPTFRWARRHVRDAVNYAGIPFQREQRFSPEHLVLLRCSVAVRRLRNRLLGKPSGPQL